MIMISFIYFNLRKKLETVLSEKQDNQIQMEQISEPVSEEPKTITQESREIIGLPETTTVKSRYQTLLKNYCSGTHEPKKTELSQEPS